MRKFQFQFPALICVGINMYGRSLAYKVKFHDVAQYSSRKRGYTKRVQPVYYLGLCYRRLYEINPKQ